MNPPTAFLKMRNARRKAQILADRKANELAETQRVEDAVKAAAASRGMRSPHPRRVQTHEHA
ncbi:hypothetical protein [Variovorax boronicumulans]|uniref:hypothetical protein n=1 Tax=Variovorax boronicumulans TaxID=436515 RepID=UPI0012E40941|nr:hypothetical protein [Variovorax boronicumulans]GER16694.1 hypothetical protein VCH24_17000 [Variovorax boronicumulans]